MLVLVQFAGDVPLPTQIPITDEGATFALTGVNEVTAQLVENDTNVWTAERVCTIVDVTNGIIEVEWDASDFATPGSYELYLRVYWNSSANVETVGPIALRIQSFPLLTSIPQAAPGTTPPDATVHNLTISGATTGLPTATLTAAGIMRQPWINPLDPKYGADPTGVVPWDSAISAAINDAISSGLPIRVPDGCVFAQSGSITKSAGFVLSGHFTINYSGTTGPAFTIQGSLGPQVPWTANGARGDQVISVASAGLSAGDLLLLGNNLASYTGDADNAARLQGQVTRVYDAAGSSTQVTLVDPLYTAYANTPFYQKLTPVKGLVLRGFTIKNTVPTNTVQLVSVSYADSPVIKIDGQGAGGAGINLQGCYNIRVRHEARQYYDQAITGLQQFGYGVAVSDGTAHGAVTVLAEQVRHAFVAVGSGKSGSPSYGEPQNIVVRGVAHGTTSTAWDVHASSWGVLFEGCRAYGGRGYGFQIRGQGSDIQGGVADNCNGGVWLFENAGDCRINGLRVNKTNYYLNTATDTSGAKLDTTGASGPGIRIDTNLTGLIVADCQFERIATCGIRGLSPGTLQNARLLGNSFDGCGVAGVSGEKVAIRIGSASSRVRVLRNTVEDTQTAKTTLCAFEFDGAATDTVVDENTIHNNIAYASLTGGAVGTVRLGRAWRGPTSGAQAGYAENNLVLTWASVLTVDGSLSGVQTVTLAGATTLTIPSGVDGQRLTLHLIQDATGGRTVTWPGNVTWPAGHAPALQSAAGGRDVVTLQYDATAAVWVGVGSSAVLSAGDLSGTLSSGVDLWTPADFGGLKAQRYPIDQAGVSSTTGTAPFLWLFRIKVVANISVGNVVLGVNVAGATLTNCYAGLYTANGTLIGTTADQSTLWTSAGLKTMALVGGSFALTPGYYYVAVQVGSATTQPQFAATAGSTNGGITNVGLSGATLHAASSTGSNGALPASITMSSNAALGRTIWAALS